MVVVHQGAQRAPAGSPRLIHRAVRAVRSATRAWMVIVLVAFISGVVLVAATPRPAQAAKGQLRAVVIVGPTGSYTSTYKIWAERIARTAERNGMAVSRLYSPRATWERVKRKTRDANLIVYLGHGFGFPSPYPSFLFESQMDGLGLDHPRPGARSIHRTHYYGADRVRDRLRFAPNSIVILNHLCYSAGHGEMHHPRPSRSLAVKRVDNFANGFLDAGASTVFALAFQPAEVLVDQLFRKRTNTMAAIFKKPHVSGGWQGWSPSKHDSRRTPGAKIILDPSKRSGFRRAITGDLLMTAGEWRSSAGVDEEETPPETGFSSGSDAAAADGALVPYQQASAESYSEYMVTDPLGETIYRSVGLVPPGTR